MNQLILALLLLSAGPAFAGRRPLVALPPALPAGPAPLPAVGYYGGPVISHAKVVVVYWGEGVTQELQARLGAFYATLVNSTYLDQLSEFATNIRAVDGREGTHQEIGRGTLAGAVTIRPVNPAKHLTQADVEKELEAQIARGALPRPDADTYYALHYPSGYSISISYGESCISWLADHEVYKSRAFGNVYYAMFPCASANSNNFSTLTFAASHELAEAITDPVAPLANEPAAFPAAWLRADGEEVSDLCTGTNATLRGPSESYNVNGNWSNVQGRCVGGTYTGN